MTLKAMKTAKAVATPNRHLSTKAKKVMPAKKAMKVLKAMKSMKAAKADTVATSRRRPSSGDALVQAIRTLGRLPADTLWAYRHERRLAWRLRGARREGRLSGEDEAELAAMSTNDSKLAAMSKRRSGAGCVNNV